MIKEAVLLNGISELALTKLDILDGLKEIKVAYAYKYKGKTFKEFPCDFMALKNARPIYKEFPGWNKSVDKIRCYKDLPKNAKGYISGLADMSGVKISMVSVGSGREDTIFLD
jgi:adenylosuccinate synthase